MEFPFREVKVRAWNDLQGGYFCGPQLTLTIDSSVVDERGFPLSWFSGFRDNEMRMLFEGDVVRIAGYGDCIVRWPFDELIDAYPEGDIEQWIGDIFNNPELSEAP